MNNRTMPTWTFFAGVTLLLIGGLMSIADAQEGKWATVAEQTNYVRTSSYEETVDYCRRLDEASPWVKLTTFGRSPQGRDLHLMIVSREGATTPEAVKRTGKVGMLIINGIHSGEIEGKDACLALVRDIAITKKRADLLDNVILLIVPIFNVDGHENTVRYTRPNQDGPENAGFRSTAQRMNLNRDFLKCDTREMQHWVMMWREWMPDFFVDDHVTDGQDWQYTVTYQTAWQPNSDTGIVRWVKQYFDSSFTRQVETAGYKVFPYAFPFRGNVADGLQTFVDTPRFSTGYTALWNRPGLLIEMHSLKEYEPRVKGNYAALVAVMNILNEHGAELQVISRVADQRTEGGIMGPQPVTYERTDDSVMVDVYTYASSLDSSTITGGHFRTWDRSKPIKVKAPYFGRFKAKERIVPPRAYLIPREWTDQINLLRLHGVLFDTLTSELTAKVERYYLDSVKWDDNSFESHLRVSYKTIKVDTTMTFEIGTAVIDMQQPAAKVVMQALEPQAEDSFVSWGLWNTIFERKEYMADYTVEPYAESLMTANASIRAEYEARLASDSMFAKSVSAKREFFYKRSRFYEYDYNWYPVSRLISHIQMVPPWKDWNE